nr:immunoglobulin heavy chain junction region [Macaca mulatta]MOW23072.1 immunoglobulin heavy chain junction region [Macaca mulatta]
CASFWVVSATKEESSFDVW